MATKRIETVRLDVVSGSLLDDQGDKLPRRRFPRIAYKESIIVNLFLIAEVDSSGTLVPEVVDVDSADTLQAALDSNFDRTESSDVGPMISVADGQINQTGEFAGGDANPALGEFSIQLDADTTAYAARVGTTEEQKNVNLELVVLSSGSTPFNVYRLPFRAFNIITDL